MFFPVRDLWAVLRAAVQAAAVNAGSGTKSRKVTDEFGIRLLKHVKSCDQAGVCICDWMKAPVIMNRYLH